MSERYTSPELSRQLADAGVEFQRGDHVWCEQERTGEPHIKCVGHVCKEYGYDGQSGTCEHPSHVRALDLTDCLDEIRALEPMAEWSVHTCDLGYACRVLQPTKRGGIQPLEGVDPESVVEAAGRVLLALLKERK